ncbi:unnamed protein product [Cylicocyclus nassatus]|uniref:Hexosyltransferase n=1 Tax=Cylicocyclus nassatus TaxID=53992 RepID=A0AA36DQ21_CYLNA|nr:unnamed protein product [Cylicocyclus nassatus]
MSSPASTSDLYKLQKEQELHDDLIVTNMSESYDNLNLKVYASFIFHQEYCPMAQFLMKVDGDVAVHLDRMDKLWKRTDRASQSIFCLVCAKSKPERNSSHKWFLSYDDWSQPFYPPFCSGPMYVMGKDAGWRILSSAHLFAPLRLEDVLFTGIIAEKVNVPRENWKDNVLLIWGSFSVCLITANFT